MEGYDVPFVFYAMANELDYANGPRFLNPRLRLEVGTDGVHI
jgi:hypothetical protein